MNVIIKLFCLFCFILVNKNFAQFEHSSLKNRFLNDCYPEKKIFRIIDNTDNNQSRISVLDSIVVVYKKGEKMKNIYYYNNKILMKYFITQIYNDGSWLDVEKHINKYNSIFQIDTIINESFDNTVNQWVYSDREIFKYDSSGNRIYELYQYFNDSEFVNSRLRENFFKESNLVYSVNKHWEFGQWVNNFKIINVFTSDNLKDSTIFQDWVMNNWLNNQLNLYTYNEDRKLIYNLVRKWDENKWLDSYLGRLKYDENGNLLVEIWKIAQTDTWINWFKINYEYDDKHNLIHIFGEKWENNQWVPDTQLLLVRNPDGFLYGYLATDIFLYYNILANIKYNKSSFYNFELYQNYPNPFNPVTEIKFNIPESGNTKLVVYNTLGEKVKTLVDDYLPVGEHKVNFDAGELPSGIYFYKLTSGKYSSVKKMILMK